MTYSASTSLFANRIAGFVALSAVIAVVVLAFGYAFGAPTNVVFNNIPFALLICATISASAIVLTTVVERLVSGWPTVAQWAAFLPAFALAGLVGTFLTAVIVAVLGVVPFSGIGTVVAENVRGTVPTSIMIGTVIMAFEHGKARLRAVEAQLQTQRLERERAERLASEAQLASLTARVQPHFLFNTLNSIAALVREQPDAAEQLIERLSAVLRSSLDTSTLVPLDRELALVRDYLGIHRSRFGDRLRFEVDAADPAPAATPIPPFAIQTLVENAIKHVAGQRDAGVSIQVRVHTAGGETIVDVVDDGDGFTPGQLKGGHGLDTLQGRLRAMYGTEAALEFERRTGGMLVRLRVPAVAPGGTAAP